MAQTGKLGSPDSLLASVQLALLVADALRPLTPSSQTGELGTSHSLLGQMRPALGDQEGDAAGTNTYTVSAVSTLSLVVQAGATLARQAASSDTLYLGETAAAAVSRPVRAASDISALSSTAGVVAVRSFVAESIIVLTDAAMNTGRTIHEVAGHSDLELTADAGAAAVRLVAASDTLALASAARSNRFPTASAESAISLQSMAIQVGRTVEVAATSELSLTDEAAGVKVTVYQGDCGDFLPLTDWATVAVVRNVSARNTIALSQAERVGRPWYLSAETPLQTVTYGYKQATDTFYPVYEGLKDSARAARPLTAVVHQSIPLAQSASVVRVKPSAISVSAESVLELLGEVRLSPTGKAGDWLTLGQTATVEKCKLVKSVLNLTQEAAVLVSVPRGAASALGLSQAATYSIVSRSVLGQYKPFVGEGADGSPTPPAVTIGPPEHVALRFQLFYPAEGVVTDAVTLRAPNLGNKDRLSFNRILRETRGGTLIVFADPIWPKVETLVLSFSGLRSVQAQQLLAFLETHLGEEIGLLDWEGRAWKGVVTSPTEPFVQDGKDSFSASLEFEGELVSA